MPTSARELQDKYARYGWDLAVHDLIATGLHGTDLLLEPASGAERAADRRDAARLRSRAASRQRNFSSLSYGQKRLALLARALVRAPGLVAAWTNSTTAWIREYRRRIDRMLDAARAAGRSWIVAAHRACDVPRGTRGIIELRDGRLHSMRALRRAELARLSR